MPSGRGKIVLMGSGEMTATMVEVHKGLLGQLDNELLDLFLVGTGGLDGLDESGHLQETGQVDVQTFKPEVAFQFPEVLEKAAEGGIIDLNRRGVISGAYSKRVD